MRFNYIQDHKLVRATNTETSTTESRTESCYERYAHLVSTSWM